MKFIGWRRLHFSKYFCYSGTKNMGHVYYKRTSIENLSKNFVHTFLTISYVLCKPSTHGFFYFSDLKIYINYLAAGICLALLLLMHLWTISSLLMRWVVFMTRPIRSVMLWDQSFKSWKQNFWKRFKSMQNITQISNVSAQWRPATCFNKISD